jgi:hypothetical protein
VFGDFNDTRLGWGWQGKWGRIDSTTNVIAGDLRSLRKHNLLRKFENTDKLVRGNLLPVNGCGKPNLSVLEAPPVYLYPNYCPKISYLA